MKGRKGKALGWEQVQGGGVLSGWCWLWGHRPEAAVAGVSDPGALSVGGGGDGS